MALLEAAELGKSFELNGRPLPVLEGITFAVSAGETAVFVGKSGCGKSTLLRILAGLITPDKGRVELLGQRVVAPSRDVSILFQRYTVFPWMTVRANVEAGLLHMGLSRQQRRTVAERQLELVGLLDYAHERPAVLSGGMQQRVALARTYAMDPQVLLMDEPFAALDSITRGEMQVELKRMNQDRRKAVVFVTHDIHEAIILADRIYVLRTKPGRIVAEFCPATSTDRDALYHSVAMALASDAVGVPAPT